MTVLTPTAHTQDEGRGAQWHRPWGGCGRRPGWASPLTCIYLGARLQEQSKVNCNPRCPSKRTKRKTLTWLKQLDRILLHCRVIVIRSKHHVNRVHKTGHKSKWPFALPRTKYQCLSLSYPKSPDGQVTCNSYRSRSRTDILIELACIKLHSVLSKEDAKNRHNPALWGVCSSLEMMTKCSTLAPSKNLVLLVWCCIYPPSSFVRSCYAKI